MFLFIKCGFNTLNKFGYNTSNLFNTSFGIVLILSIKIFTLTSFSCCV